MSEELKPCPFCGSEAEYTGECEMVWVRCSDNDCKVERINKFDDQEDAAEDWNYRAPEWSEGNTNEILEVIAYIRNKINHPKRNKDAIRTALDALERYIHLGYQKPQAALK